MAGGANPVVNRGGKIAVCLEDSRMSIFSRSLGNGILAAALFVGATSCGSVSNNDQGTSFTAIGWYIIDENDELIPSTTRVEPLALDTADPALGGGGGRAAFHLMGLQNRLSGQFININRVDCRYEVQGSSIRIPNEAIPKGFVLGSFNGPFPDQPDVEVDDEENTLPNVLFMNVDVVTTDIFSFLNVNRASLPELPFMMAATCKAVGTTQAGDVLETNEITLEVIFTDPAECCTGAPGFQNGPGSGGTPDTFSGNSSEETAG